MKTTSHRWASAAILAGFALASLCGSLFGWLSEEVLESDTVHFDACVRTYVHRHADSSLTRVVILITTIGSTVPVATLTAIALAVFWFRRMKHQAAILGFAMLGAGALSYVLKVAFHRPRPVPYFGLPVPATFSFPSGHSLVAVSFYLVLAHLIGARFDRTVIRAAIWSLAVIMVLLIGFSRVYLGVHYASDVIAGYAAGGVWIATIMIAQQFLGAETSSQSVRSGSGR